MAQYYCFIGSMTLSYLRLKGTLIAEPNSNAISLWAKVPPYLPFFTIIPTALVFSIHSETLNTKLG